jgi:hypothetical protein
MDTSLNIVNLIENNPIIKLSNTYNNKLLEKIKENFNETQQQLFISSFYCYLHYNQTTDFVIDLDNIWQWLGFTQKIAAKKLLEKNFVIEKDYKFLLCLQTKQDKEQHGGHNKQTFLLNIKTFKLLCIKAETKKANEIHEYFVKLEGILNEVIQEECIELKQQLEDNKQQLEDNKQQLEDTNNNFDKKLIQQKALQREQILLTDYGSSGSLIYIIKIKSYDTGEYIVKIGESRYGIEQRYKEHQKKYEECVLLDCFRVVKSRDFEKYLHHHDKIRSSRVKDLKDHEKEQELFHIGKELSYKTVLNIIENNIKSFNEYSQKDFDRLQEKYDLLQEKYDLLQEKYDFVKSTINSSNNLQNTISLENDSQEKINKLENINKKLEQTNKEILEKLNKPDIITTTKFGEPLATLGDRIQKINPETMTLVKVYESIAECLKESKFKMKRSSIDKAIKQYTIYNGYRWMYVERNKNPNILENIPETKVTRLQNLGYIAKLNVDKTKILNVYLDRKTAAIENGFLSSAALDNPVKNEKIANGFFYVLYDNCDENLQEDFEENNGEILLYKEGVGQYDNKNNLIKEFACKYDCIKKLKMSDKTLRKALDQKVMYNNYYFKYIGSKMKML